MIQLDPIHVILVISHNHHTFNKKNIIKQGVETSRQVSDWIQSPLLHQFYKYDIQCIPLRREEFTLRIGNVILKEAEIVQTLNQQHNYILQLSAKVKELQ